jgi:hypothetical protein
MTHSIRVNGISELFELFSYVMSSAVAILQWPLRFSSKPGLFSEDPLALSASEKTERFSFTPSERNKIIFPITSQNKDIPKRAEETENKGNLFRPHTQLPRELNLTNLSNYQHLEAEDRCSDAQYLLPKRSEHS